MFILKSVGSRIKTCLYWFTRFCSCKCKQAIVDEESSSSYLGVTTIEDQTSTFSCQNLQLPSSVMMKNSCFADPHDYVRWNDDEVCWSMSNAHASRSDGSFFFYWLWLVLQWCVSIRADRWSAMLDRNIWKGKNSKFPCISGFNHVFYHKLIWLIYGGKLWLSNKTSQ